MNRRWDKWAAKLMIRSGLLSALERRESRQPGVLRILDYHRVGEPDMSRADPSLYGATSVGFARQMEYLAREYHVVSVAELLEVVRSGRQLPPRSVMITVDDGYRDFLYNAWPALRDLRLPVILFVPTDYMGGEPRMFWWDRLYQAIYRTHCADLTVPGVGCWQLLTTEQRQRAFTSIKSRVKSMDHHPAMALVEQVIAALGVSLDVEGELLNWSEVCQMSRDGLTVCAHTMSHPILSRMAPDEARAEIAGSQAAIRSALGQAWPVFAYPVGHPAALRHDLLSILQDEGFQVAMTMIEGHNVIGETNPLRLRRVGMAPHLTMGEFRLVLTRAYNWYGWVARTAMLDGMG